jgi:hypothetical protein
MLKTTDLKLNFLGIIPGYEKNKQQLNAQEISAFSGLLTFRGDSVEDLIAEANEKGQDINKKVKFILRRSSLKGHASMATMPVFCFSFEGSKMIGSMLTGITFSSALMHSGRRADVLTDHNVYPSSILRNSEAKKIYKQASQLNIETFNRLLELEVIKDEASKILHYGTYGTGIITLPAESLATFATEYQLEKEWMPEEGGFLIEKMEQNLKKLGIDLLYATRMAAPRNTYSFPNLFKDPKIDNFVREIAKKKSFQNKENKIIAADAYLGKGFKKRVKELTDFQKQTFKNKKSLMQNWTKLLHLRRKLIRDYNTALNVKAYSNVSWRVWRDKKRHRTAPVTTESIYYLLDEALKKLKKEKLNKEFLAKGDLNPKLIKKLDAFFSIPPRLARKEETRKLYLKAAFSSMQAYEKLVKLKIPKRDAVFVIPRGFRIQMIQEYNLHNLIDGYYPLRVCPTADEQVYRQTLDEIKQIKALFTKKQIGYLNQLLEPKCTHTGLCPEEKTCGFIKSRVKNYNEALHEELKQVLEDKFESIYKKL